jgi:hypothetical protein
MFSFFPKERRDNRRRLCLDRTNNLFSFIGSFVLKQSKKIMYMSNHHYSSTPLGGLWATEEGTCDVSESVAARTQIQRASASSSVKSTLFPNPSTSSSVFNSSKCDTGATNAEWDPQWTSLVVAALIRPLSSSAGADIDATREDGPLALAHTTASTPEPGYGRAQKK